MERAIKNVPEDLDGFSRREKEEVCKEAMTQIYAEKDQIISEDHKNRIIKSLENYRTACRDCEEETKWENEAKETDKTIELVKEL